MSGEIMTEEELNDYLKTILDPDFKISSFDKRLALTIRHYQSANVEIHERYNQMVDEIRGIMRRDSYAGFVTEHDLYKLEAMLPPDAGEDEGKGITKANLLSQMKINIFSKSRSIEDDKSSTDAGEEKGK